MAKKEIRRIEIEPAENGGHTVTHHFKPREKASKGLSYEYDHPAPETHVFGKNEGHQMLAHVARNLDIPADQDNDGE